MNDKIIRNEKQFSDWFIKNFKKLKYDKILRKDTGVFPDFIMLKDKKEVRVELETLSSNFLIHKHNINNVDEIVCLIKDVNLPKPIIVANGVKHNIPVTVSIKIDENLLKEAKIRSIINNLTFSKFMEDLIKGALKK